MELIARIQGNGLVLLIPLISAFVGWFTNVLAIKMMFYPVDFKGIPPFLGWQGVIPANAMRLARTSNELINTKLLSLEQLFESFSPETFTGKLGAVVDNITEQIIEEAAAGPAKAMWDNAGEFMQGKVRETVRGEVVDAATCIAKDMGSNITNILDLEQTVMEAVGREKALMGEMFYEVGKSEFKFVERSGLYFGFLFGIVQMVVWVLYPKAWILPVAGFFVGYITNYLAIKLIFHPRKPIKIAWLTIQGLFHKRQKEVAAAFAGTVAGRVLNADNIVDSVMQSEGADEMNKIVESHVERLISKYEAHPMAAMVLPPDQRPAIRDQLLGRIQEEWPKPGGFFHTFADQSVDLRGELETRMASLNQEEYEGVLRPAFQQDEWKLIAVGAVLGFGAGVAQLVFLFGDVIEQLNMM